MTTAVSILYSRFGAKWIFAGAFLLSTVATLLSPFGASLGYGYLIGLRVIAGIGSVSKKYNKVRFENVYMKQA